MGNLKVSTIIPTYNRAHMLDRAVSSVLGQQRSGDEVLVIDDGSTDNTEQVVSRFGDSVKYVKVPNGGAGKARNIGIQRAANELIAFLDSDDEWMPHKLEIQRALMENEPDVIFSFTDFAHRKSDGAIISNSLRYWHRDNREWDEILGPIRKLSHESQDGDSCDGIDYYVGDLYVSQLKASYVFTSTVMVRRKEAGSALRFAEDTPTYEDWECFGRLAGAGMAAYLDCETAWQHGHGEYRLTDADQLTCAQARIKITKRVWGGDKEFMENNRALYDNVLREQMLIQISRLIVGGRTREARSIAREIGNCPISYRIMSELPGALVKPMVWLKRLIRSGRS